MKKILLLSFTVLLLTFSSKKSSAQSCAQVLDKFEDQYLECAQTSDPRKNCAYLPMTAHRKYKACSDDIRHNCQTICERYKFKRVNSVYTCAQTCSSYHETRIKKSNQKYKRRKAGRAILGSAECLLTLFAYCF